MNRPNDADGAGSPAALRNVVLVGASGAGKTALFEQMVAARIPGRRSREGGGTGSHAGAQRGDRSPRVRSP